MSIPERIIRERKRLGLSQAEFAHKGGVSLSSQKRYENGERAPDSSYFTSLRANGIDTVYLMNAFREDDMGPDHFAASIALLEELSEALGLERKTLVEAVDELRLMVQPTVETNDEAPFSALCKKLVQEALGKSPHCGGLHTELNLQHFCAVLETVESAQQRLKLTIAPNKKAQLLAMLLRVFSEQRQLDQTAVEEAITLVAL